MITETSLIMLTINIAQYVVSRAVMQEKCDQKKTEVLISSPMKLPKYPNASHV